MMILRAMNLHEAAKYSKYLGLAAMAGMLAIGFQMHIATGALVLILAAMAVGMSLKAADFRPPDRFIRFTNKLNKGKVKRLAGLVMAFYILKGTIVTAVSIFTGVKVVSSTIGGIPSMIEGVPLVAHVLIPLAGFLLALWSM